MFRQNLVKIKSEYPRRNTGSVFSTSEEEAI